MSAQRSARFQFSLRKLFVSLCWLGVLFAAWVTDANPFKSEMTGIPLLALYAARVVAVFPAVGALFGRTILGVGIGCAVFVLIVVRILISLRFSGGGWAI
jgi:hypothetical protein